MTRNRPMMVKRVGLLMAMLMAAVLLLWGCAPPGRYSSAYHKTGSRFLAQKKTDDAILEFQKGLDEARRTNDTAQIAMMLSLLGWAHAEKLDFKTAQDQLIQAAEIAEANGHDAALIYGRLAVVQTKASNMDGLLAAEKALDLTAERWRERAGGGSRDEIIDYALSHPGFPPDEDLLKTGIMAEAALAVLLFTDGKFSQALKWAERVITHCDGVQGIMGFAAPEDQFSFYQGKGVAAGIAGRIHANQGNTEKAAAYLKVGIEAYDAIDVTVEGDDLLGAYIASGGYQEKAHAGFAVDTRFSDAFNQAEKLYTDGKNDAALRAYETVAEQAKKDANLPEAARALSQMGWLQAEQGRYAQSITLLNESISVNPQGQEAVMSYTRLAAVLSRLGSFEQALGHADQALQVAMDTRAEMFAGKDRKTVIDAFMKNPGMPPDVVMLKAVLGSEAARTVSYYFMGDYQKAAEMGATAIAHFKDAQRVIAIASPREQKDFYDGIGYTALSTGDALAFMDRPEQGRDYLKAAEGYFQKSGSIFGRYAARALYACTYLRDKQYRKSAEIMRDIWDELEQAGLEDIIWRSKTRLAYYFDLHAEQFLARLKDIGLDQAPAGPLDEDAVTLKTELLESAQVQIDGIAILLGQDQAERLAGSLNNISAADDAEGLARAIRDFVMQLKQVAYENFEAAIERIESIRSSLETDLNKRAFRADKQILYDGLVRLSVELKGAGAGLEAVERAKARDLLDLLATKEVSFKQSDLVLQQQKIKRNVTKRLQIASLAAEPIDDNAALQAEMGQYRAIMVKVRTEEPELSSLISMDFLSFKEVAALVPAGSTLLEYYAAPQALYVFSVADGQARVRKVPITPKELAQTVKEFRKAILLRDRPLQQRLSAELYMLLIQPAEEMIRGKRLIIVPDAALHYLPFAALSKDGRYLVEHFNLVFSTSAGVLKYSRSKTRARGAKVLALGNPDLGDPALNLPHAQTEASMVALLYPGSQALLGPAATETAFRNQAANYDILHFATHDEFNSTDPLYSSLRLTGDQQNDGRLTAAEIFSLEISPSLVTLSACQTGLGLITEGGEIIGMNRSFIYAGAPSVLSTLWSVNDASTNQLMQVFYKKLKKMLKDEALRSAQMELINGEDFIDPFYWAPFYLSGDWQ